MRTSGAAGMITAPIEIKVDNDPKNPLLAYGFVKATALGENEIDVLRLPALARRPGSQDEVVRVEDGKAHILHVPHALDTDGSWMVLRGLAPTDAIVLSPDADMKDGDPIELGGKPADGAPAPAAAADAPKATAPAGK